MDAVVSSSPLQQRRTCTYLINVHMYINKVHNYTMLNRTLIKTLQWRISVVRSSDRTATAVGERAFYFIQYLTNLQTADFLRTWLKPEQRSGIERDLSGRFSGSFVFT